MADPERRQGVVARLATILADRASGWRMPWWLPPVLLAWLLLSTIWGFGRAAFPEHATSFLVAGLVAAGLVGSGLLAVRRPGRNG